MAPFWITALLAMVTTSLPRVSAKAGPLKWRASMVHKNPGEGFTPTKYSNASVVQDLGYNIMVKQDGRPPHTAITWDSFDPDIFPTGSKDRAWVEDLASVIDDSIKEIHDSGMKAMYWFDMFVLPSKLVEKYHDQIVDDQGRWSLDSPQMSNITSIMLDLVFQRFPDLDGLVIRTGEIYTQDVPYHAGGSVITNGYKSHIELIKILEDIVIKKYNKLLLYRTWAFDGFTTDPEYYLNVTNAFEPHPNLAFVIKHTSGDFWRTLPFNPTLGTGKHQYLVEVQCQREYEGKGAIPDYVMNGVIDGFEEETGNGKHGIGDLVGDPLLQGVLSWPRGGGWGGPYPADEFWIDLNVRVIVEWSKSPSKPESDIFNSVAKSFGLKSRQRQVLRQLALLSAKGTLHGHYSVVHQLKALEWTRDDHIGGIDGTFKNDGNAIVEDNQVAAVLKEKESAQSIWRKVERLADRLRVKGVKEGFIEHSATYGRLVYDIIAESWKVELTGAAANASGTMTNKDKRVIKDAIHAYDKTWVKYLDLKQKNQTGSVSSLYAPNDGNPATGVNASVNAWRWVLDS